MDGWMEWMDTWVIQDHSVKDRQSLDCGQPGTVPRATNVCQCSQPRDEREFEAGVPEDQHTHTNTHIHTHAPAFHTVFSPCCSIIQSLHPSPPQLHRQSCQWGSSYPRRGYRLETWTLQRLLASWDWFYHSGHMSFWTGNALKNKSWRTTWLVLCYNKELFKLGKNLENAHFWKRIKEMFYFEIENLRIRILKGASALYCI